MNEVKWSAPEYHYHEKDVSWYWIVIIAAVILTALALWQKNFLFAIFIIMAAILVIVWGRRKPKMIDFTLSDKGLDIGGKKFYSFDELSGFTIVPDPHEEELSELVLKTKNKFSGWVKTLIASQRADRIKNLIGEHLPEIEYDESLTEHIARLLRF